MTIQPGSRLGPYEIVASIGAGGMGEVWRARDTRLDREVAIKVLPPGLAENGQFLQRFEREARAISQLSHPHVCTLFDVGEEIIEDRPSNLYYLVMEFLEGESLADRIKKGPLPLTDVLKYGQQIASALDAAHRRGITHRDLKPGNIMLTKSGAKLLDFGLAKTAAEAQVPIDGLTNMVTEEKPLTQVGTILGTFQYMAPEQLEGLEADARTDIFALGAVLYEMATAQRAFQAESKTNLIAAIVSAQPEPISSVVPMTPPALDHVVRKCLEKDPDDRWQSASDVASELQWISQAGSQAGVAAPITIRRKTRERLAWALVAILGTGAIAAGWLARNYRARAIDRPMIQTSIVAPEGVRFALLGVDSPPALSPDGQWIVFGGISSDGTHRLYVRKLDSTKSQPLPGTEGASYAFWSPDSADVAFFADGKLKRIAAAGGPVTTVCDAPNGRGGTWSEDGTIVVGLLKSGLFRVPADGGKLAVLIKVEKGTEDRWPWMIPGTDRFVYLEDGGPGKRMIRGGSLDGAVDLAIVDSEANPAWAAGHLLYAAGKTLMALELNPKTLERSGEPVPVADGVLFDSDFARSMFTVSNTGLLAYYAGAAHSQQKLTWFDRRGERVGTLGKEGVFGFFRISPDGKRVAVPVKDATALAPGTWIDEVTRDVQTRLTVNPGDDLTVAWSRNGKTLYFTRSGVGLMRRMTSGLEDAVLLSSESLLPRVVSPDGKTLLCVHWVGNGDVAAFDLDGDKGGKDFRTLIGTQLNESPDDVSPDGKYLLYTSDESGRYELYATTFPEPSDKWQISVGGGFAGRWSPDGKEVFYATVAPPRIMAVAVESGPQNPGKPQVVMAIPDADTHNFRWDLNPDGERFLVAVVADPHAATRSPITLVTNWTGLLHKKGT